MSTTFTANTHLGKPARGDSAWDAVLNTNWDVLDALFSTATFTAGSICFINAAGAIAQSNTTLFWDSTNIALGIGTNSVSSTWRVDISNASFATIRLTSSTYCILRFHDNSSAANSRIWDVFTNSLTLNFRISNDAESVSQNWLTVTRSGTSITSVAFPDGYIQCGGASVGSSADGQVNAKGFWDDGLAVTDYIWDLHFDGKMNEEDEKEHPDARLWGIDETYKFTQEHRHLPTMPGREEWKEKGMIDLGSLIEHLWETVEQQQIHIYELNGRLAHLELSQPEVY